MSLHAIVDAHKNGFDENMYLDSKTRTKVEETGGANFLFVTKDGKVVTPKYRNPDGPHPGSRGMAEGNRVIFPEFAFSYLRI